jgi:hypothetical protein
MRGLLRQLIVPLALAVALPQVRAATVSFAAPTLDKWMYGNVPGSVGGTRENSPVFGFPNSPTEEDRLGQMLVAFQTSAQITSGLAAASYQITRVTLSVFTSDISTNTYDPTFDSFRSHLATNDPLYQADTDAGRPVEVFGVGLRNGFTSLSGSLSGSTIYNENSAFGSNTIHGRNAFPILYDTGGTATDVSDNVSERFEAQPWAVAQIAGLTAGALIPEGSEYRFTLDLSSAAVRAYLQNGLSSGILGLMVTSLIPVPGQGSSEPYPTFLTKENQLGPEYAPRLEIEYTIVPVPEPDTATSVLLGIGFLAAVRGWRRRDRFS